MRFSIRFCITLCAALIASAAWAHHSFAVFFIQDKTVVVTGAVTEFHFVNPHGLIRLQVKNAKGELENWKFETNSPSVLRRRGWSGDSLKVGDVVTIEGWPAREDPHYGRLRSAKRANGEMIGKPFTIEE
jgi:hypothetical protein